MVINDYNLNNQNLKSYNISTEFPFMKVITLKESMFKLDKLMLPLLFNNCLNME